MIFFTVNSCFSQLIRLIHDLFHENYINKQRSKWIGNCVRSEDTTFVKQLTFPDFFKSDKKKRGIMSTTYRQVKIHYEKELKINEIEMINSFVKESSGVTDPEIQ